MSPFSAMFFRFSQKVFVLACLLSLAACATRTEQLAPTVTLPDADKVWQAYEAYTRQRLLDAAPFRANVSLRFGTKDDTRRVTAILWSNGETPVRLDISAGMGVLLARIREDASSLLIYSPRENTALSHKGPQRALLQVTGVPIPLGLTDFAALIQGEFSRVFGVWDQGKAYNGENQTISFPLEAQFSKLRGAHPLLNGRLFVNALGLPVRWQEQVGTKGWVMNIDYDEQNALPDKITLSHHDGQQAVIIIKNRELPEEPFNKGQLALSLPPTVNVRSMQP